MRQRRRLLACRPFQAEYGRCPLSVMKASVCGVRMRPGLIVLTRIPCGPPSIARWGANDETAPLPTPWPVRCDPLERCAVIEDVLMIEPPARLDRHRTAATDGVVQIGDYVVTGPGWYRLCCTSRQYMSCHVVGHPGAQATGTAGGRRSLFPGVDFGEDFCRDLVGVVGPGGTGVGLEVDEQVDDFVCRDAAAQGYAELPA